LNQNLPDAKKK